MFQIDYLYNSTIELFSNENKCQTNKMLRALEA